MEHHEGCSGRPTHKWMYSNTAIHATLDRTQQSGSAPHKPLLGSQLCAQHIYDPACAAARHSVLMFSGLYCTLHTSSSIVNWILAITSARSGMS